MGMKFIYTLLFAFIGFGSMASLTINSVLGDKSYVAKFGVSPTTSTNDNLRIRTHLEYVETNLRATSTAHLSQNALLNRNELLNALHDYWTNNVFPSPSVEYVGRKPCFIDSKGRICAVGYLIEHASGREVAEQINSKYKFEYLLEMNDPLIDDWAAKHGFTLDELAQNQPSYDYMRGYSMPLTIIPARAIYTGPSKKELALTAELDSLRPIHDSIVIVLDSSLRVISSQEMALTKLQNKLNQKGAASKKRMRQSLNEEIKKKTLIYILSGAFIALLGFSIFNHMRLKRKR